jgi:ABC-type transport system involved in multi-copper enzyme maturation permease subunit
MESCLKKTWWKAFDVGRLTGPIFGKELRVSSRRTRNYALRFFYIALLTVFVAIVWLSVAEYEGNATFLQSRMAVVGKQVVATVVIFQFVAMQLLAIVMLSNAISDELYHRTLGLLMTTPINSLQIVMGKVLSRLLQLVLLLTISLPILAIVRVFGGVSWGYLLSSLCMTLTAAIFAGSVSLLLSIGNRHAYGVIIRTVFVLGGLYFILPSVVALWGFVLPRFGLASGRSPSSSVELGLLLLHSNPAYVMSATTVRMLSPGSAPGVLWPVHCGVMLALAAAVLGRAVVVVRKVALRQATGEIVVADASGWARDTIRGTRKGRRRVSREIRRVQGPPVVWRELRTPFIQGIDSRNSYIGFAIAALALVGTYIAGAWQGALDEDFTHVMFALLFVFLGVIINVVFAAMQIPAERESQSWPLLLATPLSDWDILFGKAVSAVRRCLPVWILLGGHVLLFVLVGYIHPVAIIHLALLVGWLTCFLTASALYFSVRFTRTTSAVVASFALIGGLWAIGPMVAGLVSVLSRHGNLSLRYLWTHPAIQTELIMAGASGRQNAHLPWHSLRYGSERILFAPAQGVLGVGRMTYTLAAIAAVYIVVSLLFFWRAKCRLRRNVF